MRERQDHYPGLILMELTSQKNKDVKPMAIIQPGTKISHYEIMEIIGSGGMGAVFKAKDIKLGRLVALKFLINRFNASENEKTKFLREAISASALNHPNICVIYDFEEIEDYAFIAMEFVDGQTIKYRIKNGSLDLMKSIDLAIQVASGLGAAHGRDIVHGDIKSDNIMLNQNGLVKIMDFGLARLLQNDTTRSATIAGTPHYMSPEQIEGRAIDQRSDIFSLGIVLYEMVTGHLPFDGDYHIPVLYSIVNSRPRPIDDFVPEIPSALCKIIYKCLEKSPEDRYQNCGELTKDLQKFSQINFINGRDTILPDEKSALRLKQEKPVGRDKEIKEITALIDSAYEGKGRTLIIEGEAGAGKTQLSKFAAEYSKKRGMNVFSGRCLYKEAGFPYYPFIDALKKAFTSPDESMFDILMEKASSANPNDNRVIPILKTFLNIGNRTEGLLNKEQLWDSILQFFRLITLEKPAVLIVDDIHWMDGSSLGLFLFLARNISNLPILILANYRGSDIKSEESLNIDLEDSIRQLKIDGLTETMTLDRLNKEDLSALVRILLNGDDIIKDIEDFVYESTRGNPLFILELVSLLKSQGGIYFDGQSWKFAENIHTNMIPDHIRDIIIQRLHPLGKEDHDLLEFAACEGQQFHSETLVGCLNLPRLDTLKRLQAIQRNYSLIQHEKEHFQFDHPLIRDVIYEETMGELRQEYHRIIAHYLITNPDKSAEEPSKIAHHLLASDQASAALPYLMRAAERALQLYAIEDALSYYRKALGIANLEGGRNNGYLPIIYHGIGDCCLSLGKPAEAEKYFQDVLKLPESDLPESIRISTLRRLGDIHRMIGKAEDAISYCQDALRSARLQNNRSEIAQCLNTLGFVYFSRAGNWDLAIEHLTEALELGKSSEDLKTQAISLGYLGLTFLHKGELKSSAGWLEQATQMQKTISDERGLSQTLNYLGLLYDRMGHFEQAIFSFTESIRIKRKIGDLAAIPGSLNGLGDTYRDLSDLRRAKEYHTQSLEMARDQKNIGAQCDNLRDLGVDYMLDGQHELAEKYLNDVLKLSVDSKLAWYETRSLISLGELKMMTGKSDDARLSAAEGLEKAKSLNSRELVIESLLINARIHRMLDKQSIEISEALTDGIELARKGSYNVLLWQLTYELARYYSGIGQEENASRYFQSAKEILSEIFAMCLDSSICEKLRNSEKVAEIYALRA